MRIRLLAEPGSFLAAPPKAFGMFFEVNERAEAFDMCGDDAVVDICGPLMRARTPFGENYTGIVERVAAALDSNATRVVLKIDSPGGDFAGCLETAATLRTMAVAAGKPLVAYIDGRALSAGYALACAASEIVITPSASLGSIGVWAPLASQVAADAAMGVQYEIVSSGARKTDGNPHVQITKGAVSALQAQVDTMAQMFFEHVTACRAVDADSIAALEGAEVFGARALAAGLADRIVTNFAEFQMEKTQMATMKAAGGKAEEMTDKVEDLLDKVLDLVEEKDGETSEEKEARMAKVARLQKAMGVGAKKAEDASPDAKDDDKDAEKKDDKKAAAAKMMPDDSNAAAFTALREVQALSAKLTQRDEADERASLLAQRPDFAPSVRKSLATMPLTYVRDAVANWERSTAPGTHAAVTPTQGAQAGKATLPTLSQADSDLIDARMGRSVQANGVRTVTRPNGGSMSLELGVPTYGLPEVK